MPWHADTRCEHASDCIKFLSYLQDNFRQTCNSFHTSQWEPDAVLWNLHFFTHHTPWEAQHVTSLQMVLCVSDTRYNLQMNGNWLSRSSSIFISQNTSATAIVTSTASLTISVYEWRTYKWELTALQKMCCIEWPETPFNPSVQSVVLFDCGAETTCVCYLALRSDFISSWSATHYLTLTLGTTQPNYSSLVQPEMNINFSKHTMHYHTQF